MNIFPHKHNFLTTEDSFLFYITYKEVVIYIKRLKSHRLIIFSLETYCYIYLMRERLILTKFEGENESFG